MSVSTSGVEYSRLVVKPHVLARLETGMPDAAADEREVLDGLRGATKAQPQPEQVFDKPLIGNGRDEDDQASDSN